MRGPEQLTGLIIAREDIAGATGMLRAELPVAGQTVLEQQVRLLAEVGAGRIIVIAEHLPQNLAVAVNRLRRDALAVEVVRQVDDVVLRVRPEERLILLGDGVVADVATAERLLAAPPPAILVLPDTAETRGWELIDATARWAGLLVADGDLVRRTARMLGDWDLQSTLLRNAIQAGAERLPATGAGLLAQAVDANAAVTIEAVISRQAVRRHSSWVDRWLFDPIARLLAPRAMAAMVEPVWLRGGALALWTVAGLLFLANRYGLGLAAALLAGPVDTLGRHLAGLTMRLRREEARWTLWKHGAGAGALVALGWSLRDLGWGNVAITGATIGFVTALLHHERWIGRPSPRPLWLAEPDGLAWLYLPFALAGWWTAGLGAQAGLALASLLVVQRLTGRQS